MPFPQEVEIQLKRQPNRNGVVSKSDTSVRKWTVTEELFLVKP